MSASEELERLAVGYAKEAIQLESQGAKGLAVSKYQRAIEVLLKLCALYPGASQNQVYMQNADRYRRRISLLGTSIQNPQAETTEGRPSRFDQLVLTEKPDVKWNDIADLKECKNAIEESIVFPAKRPDLFPLGWPRGILFYGPPGCGKTMLAAAIATEINAHFYCVDAASIMSKWLGDSEKNVSHLFQNARGASKDGSPAIVFIDEIDSLVGRRFEEVGGETRTRNQFLKEMDGMLDKKRSLSVYVIGATNRPWDLDQAIIRRFQKRIFVPLPETPARLELFHIYGKDLRLADGLDINYLATITAGYSGSDIRDLFQSAQIFVVREFFHNGGSESLPPRAVQMRDFVEALKRRKPSISSGLMERYEKWTESFAAQ